MAGGRHLELSSGTVGWRAVGLCPAAESRDSRWSTTSSPGATTLIWDARCPSVGPTSAMRNWRRRCDSSENSSSRRSSSGSRRRRTASAGYAGSSRGVRRAAAEQVVGSAKNWSPAVTVRIGGCARPSRRSASNAETLQAIPRRRESRGPSFLRSGRRRARRSHSRSRRDGSTGA